MAQNPRVLGIGIDENSALILEDDDFRVMPRRNGAPPERKPR